jgi:sugar-specific transcriptional regulator TrmB
MTFPDKLEHGKLVLINKSGKDPSNPKSYRPITPLSALGKVIEKLIIHHLTYKIKQNDIYHENQFAYRKEYSTERSVLKICNVIDDMKVEYNFVLLLSLDISGAFDNIKWSAILSELKSNKINNSLIRIVTHYLTNRTINYLEQDHMMKRVLLYRAAQCRLL